MEISPLSSFAEREQEVEDAGGRTPGSPMEGTPVLKRKHDDDYSTRRVESRFESSTKEAYTSRQKKCKVISYMRRASRRTQIGFNMAFDPCLESDWLPHVEAIINVIFDGNCGYRCIAFGLGLADVNGWRIVRIRMYDEIIGYEDLWAGSAWLEFRDCQECGAFSREARWGIFQKMVNNFRHEIVSIYRIQCHSRQPLVWECFHIPTFK